MNAYPAIYTPMATRSPKGGVVAADPVPCVVLSHHLMPGCADDFSRNPASVQAVAVDGTGKHIVDEIWRFQADPFASWDGWAGARKAREHSKP